MEVVVNIIDRIERDALVEDVEIDPRLKPKCKIECRLFTRKSGSTSWLIMAKVMFVKGKKEKDPRTISIGFCSIQNSELPKAAISIEAISASNMGVYESVEYAVAQALAKEVKLYVTHSFDMGKHLVLKLSLMDGASTCYESRNSSYQIRDFGDCFGWVDE